MNVRPAVPDDALRIAQVHVDAWQVAYRGILSSEYLGALSIASRATAWTECLVRGSPEVWVAETTDGLIGWIAFGASRDVDARDGAGELEAVYVLPSRWSKGVGRALWSAARQRLIARGFSRATLWVLTDNERAIRFYRAAGFRPLEGPAKSIQIGNQTLSEMRYEVVLG